MKISENLLIWVVFSTLAGGWLLAVILYSDPAPDPVSATRIETYKNMEYLIIDDKVQVNLTLDSIMCNSRVILQYSTVAKPCK
jgi:hypothetical protein